MDWKTPKLKKLAQAFLSVKTTTDMMNLLRDLCTLEELTELSGRWEAVGLLNKGVSYREIAKQTGLSTTTITRVAHWLNHGEGGYNTVLSLKP